MRQKRTYGFAHVPTNDPLYLDVAEITFTDRRTSATRTFNATAFPNHPILAKAFLSALYRHSYTQSFASWTCPGLVDTQLSPSKAGVGVFNASQTTQA
jgi:hypothetical protein